MDVRIHLDSNGQDLAVEHSQDVEPILERNKLLRTMDQKSDWGREIAEIPNVILVRWLNEEAAKGNTAIRLLGEEMDRLVARKLADPDWAYLRTDRPALQAGWSANL
jgi:hypothetical protein